MAAFRPRGKREKALAKKITKFWDKTEKTEPEKEVMDADKNAPPAYHKYRAKKTVIDGVTFASKKEARRYGVLKKLEMAGEIEGLSLQPQYDLHTKNGVKVCAYRPDFVYLDKKTGLLVIEDCKGFLTDIYRLKRKWMLLEYGIEILET